MSRLPTSARSGNGVAIADSPDTDEFCAIVWGGTVVEEPIPGIAAFGGNIAWNGDKGKVDGAFLARQFEMIRLITFHIGVTSRPLVSIVLFKTPNARDRSERWFGAWNSGVSSSDTMCIMDWKQA